ncbi:MAG: NUDIX hydrolase [Chloroflexi bacterium]|jgi:8-oxo-dGTP pyrophosphatase MutT (NUDIX family)|nr:NUDIX hydrolase [Chloroflexota bacterium]
MALSKRIAVSAGGLVIRAVGGQPEIVVGRRKRERDGYVWSLPKGTPEEGETREETALREVREESGLEVRILSYFDAISYSFVRTGERIEKTVHYYIMEAIGGSFEQYDKEFDELRWVRMDEAVRLLDFQTESGLVQRAYDALTRD